MRLSVIVRDSLRGRSLQWTHYSLIGAQLRLGPTGFGRVALFRNLVTRLANSRVECLSMVFSVLLDG